jgi:hypothetical protein
MVTKKYALKKGDKSCTPVMILYRKINYITMAVLKEKNTMTSDNSFDV